MDQRNLYQAANSGNTELQKFSHSIGSNIQKISQNVKSLKQLVNQLGTDQDNQQLRSQLHQVQHYTGCLAKDTNIELKAFQKYAVPAGEDPRTWQMQADRLTKDFTQALNDFQSAQRQAASKEKEALKEAKVQNDLHFWDNTTGSALVDLNSSSGSTKVNQMQLQAEQDELQSLHEREAQIKQLESDIFDVNQIFKDLSTMVHEQGEIIDSIEANVEIAQQNVAQGATELRQARRSQNKARKKKLCLILSLVILLIIIIIIIVETSK